VSPQRVQRKKRGYMVAEVYEAIGSFYVEATSMREALEKVSEHFGTPGGHPDVQPLGGSEGGLISRKAERATPDEEQFYRS